MGVEPLQDVPLINLVLHWAVFLLSLGAIVLAGLLWRQAKKHQRGQAEFITKLLFFGFIFYAVSEYSDLFTPGLKASLGVHNYFTEGTLFVGMVFLFLAIKRLISSDTDSTSTAQTPVDVTAETTVSGEQR